MAWKKIDDLSKKEDRIIEHRLRGRRARFLVDESLGIHVARMLRNAPLRRNVKYVSEVGLTGRSDEDVFAYAWKTKRVLLTHDPDFLSDRRFPVNRNHGVIVLTPGSSGNTDYRLERALILISRVFDTLSKFWIGCKILVSEEYEWTVRWPDGSRDRYRWDQPDMLHWE